MGSEQRPQAEKTRASARRGAARVNFTERQTSLRYAATWGYMSMILAVQYGLMLNLSSELERRWDEMGPIWLRGLRTRNT